MSTTAKNMDPLGSSADRTFLRAPIDQKSVVEAIRCHCHRPLPEDVATRSTQLNGSSSTPPSHIPLELLSSSGTSTNKWKEGVGRENLRELCIHCFLSSSLPEFNNMANRYTIDSLPLLTEEPFRLTKPSPHSALPSNRETWPADLDKKAYYPPLTELLNEILENFNSTVNLDDRRGVRFITYDRPIASVNPPTLKPGLFLVGGEFSNLESPQWKHPLLPLEVNSNVWDALEQLGLYAREMLSARPERWCCWALHFDHIQSNFRVIQFTPESVQCSQPAIITSAAGYRDMVRIIVALLSHPNLLTVGEDCSRDSRTKILPNGDRLEILAVEFDRKELIGRRTRILSVVVVESETATENSKASAEDDGYVLKKQKNPQEVITFADNRDHLEVGERFVIKESWPLVSRSNVEWRALRSCAKEFGLPEVVYWVIGKHPISVTSTREPRVPQHIALREKGFRLVEAGSPRILLTAVLHAIIGHWNLFQKGWLHRDVSIGNVLMLAESVTKPQPTGLKSLGNLMECRGMLIDGDGMIHLSSEHEPGIRRLCTTPFLSLRLVRAWRFGTKTFDQYLDDLESFAWVLLWALIEIAEAHTGATVFDQDWMGLLNADSLQALAAGKLSIVSQLRDLAMVPSNTDPTSLSDPFIKILDHWFNLVKAKGRCGNSKMLPSSEESTALYEAFITFAMTKMDELPETWDFENQLTGSSLP